MKWSLTPALKEFGLVWGVQAGVGHEGRGYQVPVWTIQHPLVIGLPYY